MSDKSQILVLGTEKAADVYPFTKGTYTLPDKGVKVISLVCCLLMCRTILSIGIG